MPKKHEATELELRDQLLKKLAMLRQFHALRTGSEISKEILSITEAIEHDLTLDIHYHYPQTLITLIDSFLSKTAPYQIIAEQSKLLDALDHYHIQLKERLSEIWVTTDPQYNSLVKSPQKFKPKTGGAKMGGARTGVYTFEKGNRKETMLIKQGENVGETVAEYLGANLYNLTLPDNSAKCLLMKDQSNPNGGINDVYVASIYEKADKPPQDAFQAAGYPSRTFFDGLKARFKKYFGIEDCLVRKVIKIDQEEAHHSLAKCAASVLWHGDNDFHTGNFLLIEKDGQKKFSKIDHGFSFFDFKKQVVNIYNPFGGKVFNVSFSRALKGGKLVEFYPTNHFWDFAVESRNFYYNDTFITACDEILSLKPAQIQANLHQSLEKVIEIYGPAHATEALRSFGKRIGMTEKEINQQFTEPTPETIAFHIETFMTKRLVERQKSIEKIADHCREQARLATPQRAEISSALGNQIINLLEVLTTAKQQPKSDYSHNIKKALKHEIAFLKMLQQANDLGLIKTIDHKIILSRNFYVHHQGERRLITPVEFQHKLDSIISRRTFENELKKKDYPFPDKISLSDVSINLLQLTRKLSLESDKRIHRPSAKR